MIANDLPRILIADADTQMSQKLGNFLKERGFKTRVAVDASGCISFVQNWKPDFLIYDMMLPDLNALEFLKMVSRGKIKLPEGTAVTVISNHNAPENVNACLHAGANDFIVKPISNEEILSRLAFHMQKRKKVTAVAEDSDNRGDYFLYLTEMVLRKSLGKKKDVSEQIFDLLHMESMATHAVRCSLIEINEAELTGTVLRSSDDKDFSGFCIQLQKYPEITTVIKTKKPVAIEDLSGNKTMSEIKKDFKNISFNSLVVCPVFVHDELFGVVSARRKDNSPVLSDADIRFCQVTAHICGLLLQTSNPFAKQKPDQKKVA